MARRRRHRVRAQPRTAARGYDYKHHKMAAALLARWSPGQICTYCGQPMWQRWMLTPSGRRVSAIHLAHTPDRRGYEGLQHAHCNLSEAATRGNRARVTGSAALEVRQSRNW